MATKRHKPEEIVSKLRQVDVLVGQGMARVDAIRQVSITEQTYYRWRKQYGGMGTDQLKELKKLQCNVLSPNRKCSLANLDLADKADTKRGTSEVRFGPEAQTVQYWPCCIAVN